MSKVKEFINLGDIFPPGSIPKHFPDSIQYETYMGSHAYGVSTLTSDFDVYGFCIPEKKVIFPQLVGHINGFGPTPSVFKVWESNHKYHNEKEYDFNIYNIVHYFDLVMNGNPNMIDSLFTTNQSVIYSSSITNMVRERRTIFLSKKCFHSFLGFAHSQLAKIEGKKHTEGKRKALIDEFGYDVKFAYHLIRLVDELSQILTVGDLDLMANKDKLKSIRKGEWPLEDVKKYFYEREIELQKLYETSSLQHKPNYEEIHSLLVNCLEQYYGNLKGIINTSSQLEDALKRIKGIINECGY